MNLYQVSGKTLLKGGNVHVFIDGAKSNIFDIPDAPDYPETTAEWLTDLIFKTHWAPGKATGHSVTLFQEDTQ